VAQTFPKSSTGTEAARRLIAAGGGQGGRDGTAMAIAVVDDGRAASTGS
jgi:hypothetical protein